MEDSKIKSIAFPVYNKIATTKWKDLECDYDMKLNTQLYDNMAQKTGQQSGIMVVDIDILKEHDKRNGVVYASPIIFDMVKNTKTFTVKSKSGGVHLYYRYDAEIKSAIRLGGKYCVDIISDGKYIVKYYNGLITEYSDKIITMPKNLNDWIMKNQTREVKSKSVKTDKPEINADYYLP
jgi:hypothetical protein